MNLILIGRSSFIATHIASASASSDVLSKQFSRDDHFESGLGSGDVVINCALSPRYSVERYKEDHDIDLAIARRANYLGARVVMLSTRRVYSAARRWNAQEDGVESGDETAYGQNKAITEQAILSMDSRNAVLRLSNVFGMEFCAGRPRNTFFGIMLRRLKEEDVIQFDMSYNTLRDFIPVELCAKAIIRFVQSTDAGVINLGAGFPTRCGDLASWVIKGYGRGRLQVDSPIARDEFYLNSALWTSKFGRICEPIELKNYCIDIGRQLKCVK